MVDLQKIFNLQEKFDNRLNNSQNSNKYFYAPILLQKIKEFNEELIEFALGDIGKNLKFFVDKIDINHPESLCFFDNIVENDNLFSQDCLELLNLGKLAKDNNLVTLIPLMKEVFCKKYISNNIVKKFGSPYNNRLQVRLISSKSERELLRMTKKMQIINYNIDCEEDWKNNVDNFDKFLRFEKSYEYDLDLAEKKLKKYEDIGCISLAAEIQKSIDIFLKSKEQSYYGFNKISIAEVAVILAKSLKYNFHSNFCNFVNLQYKLSGNILVRRDFFNCYNFDPEKQLEFSSFISQAAGYPIFITKQNLEAFHYEPRVYPLYELKDIISEQTAKIIDTLENFPDVGNKPIFDHFLVVVPGVAFPPLKNKFYSFLDEQGINHSYQLKEDAVKHLDKILIKGRYFYPILIGERDGKCYFISYF